MRTLADRLGIRAASLYWHFRDKEQLLELLAEAIQSEVPVPDPGLPWRNQLEVLARTYRTVLGAHRDAALVVRGFRASSSGLRMYEHALRTLIGAGFDPEDAVSAAALILGDFVPSLSVSGPAAWTGQVKHGSDFSASPGSSGSGRLLFTHGATHLILRADPSLQDLYMTRFEGRSPSIQVRESTVVVEGHGHGRRHSSELVLNANVPWEVELQGGAVHMTAQLNSASLRSFVVGGGASDVTLVMPAPEGTVPVRVEGGVNNVAIHRPPGTPVRVRIGSGASRLALDALQFGSVGGEIRWQTPDFDASVDRHDIDIRGGARRLTIDTETPAPQERRLPGALVDDVREELRAKRPDEYPTVLAVIDQLTDPDLEARFEFGLTVLLDGLERRLASRQR